jgi:hypothetical protein
MKKEEVSIFTDYLVKTQGLTADEVTSLFETKDEEQVLISTALDKLLPHDVKRVKGFKDKIEEARTKGYDKAKAEVLSKYEQELKDKLGVTSEKVGPELHEEILEKFAKGSNLDADKIKVHPEYLKIEKELKRQHKEELDKKEKEFTEFKTGVEKEKIFGTISNKALEKLAELKPILSKDANKAANQKKVLIDELKGYDFQENGDDIVIMKEGKRLEDMHGKPISFETLVKETAGKYWDFESGTHHSGSGADNNPGQKPGQGAAGGADNPYKGKIKSEGDFSKYFNEAKTAQDRAHLITEYDAAKPTFGKT